MLNLLKTVNMGKLGKRKTWYIIAVSYHIITQWLIDNKLLLESLCPKQA